ncbi:hypothetical protein AZH53_06405 [Methanomicrobiaceae archaeon CYW5]|uniref:VWA domain-containing protein n=1 Tax=Methanovulcanius yangii TaxID=1789227 RepID=UPI0029C9D23B|nr:VWA domain-containing protein [Methanovulcanius yangii]MBT8508037.1 hypothetical protein [Methanovulcanius yangii]
MKATYILVLLLAFLIVWPVCALGDGDVTVSVIGSPGHGDWLIAGDGAAIITVKVHTEGETIREVRFDCVEASVYGDVDRYVVTELPYRTTFSTQKSGSVPIRIAISYINETGCPAEFEKVYSLDVDHAAPYRIRSIDFSAEAGVYDIIPITVVMEDRYGNVIDSRYEDDGGDETSESVLLYGTVSDEAGFFDGETYGHDSAVCHAGPDGACAAYYRTGTRAGEYIIHVMPEAMGGEDAWIRITAGGGGVPVSISVAVDPCEGNPGVPAPVPADGMSGYSLVFALKDQFGNPCAKTPVRVRAGEDGEVRDLLTTFDGTAMVSYGPRNTVGNVTITGESVLNPSVSCSVDLSFASSEPVTMILMANPQSMASSDVDGAPTAEIMAKVMDICGNPVAGETVLFSIYHPVYPSSQVEEPYLTDTSVMTDEDGMASVTFVPGAFNTAPGMPGHEAVCPYDETAVATCTITALWGGMSRDIDLEWRNYPYLRVETGLSGDTVAVNDTVDVTISLVGDGWALHPAPVDVVVAVDRSGSMLMDDIDRMVYEMAALKTFISRMNEGKDRIGMVTFGSSGYCDSRWGKPGVDYSWNDDLTYVATHYPGSPKTYTDYATLDLGLTGIRADVSAAVEGIVPWGGTPMRYALYTGLREIVQNGRDDAVRAVILLSDGDYNWYGDPLARGNGKTPAQKSPTDMNYFSDGTEKYTIFEDLGAVQNLSEYAAGANVRIYSIAFADSFSVEGRETLRILAESTGGKFYEAPNGGQLAGIYTDIAGDLRTVAGVDTEMEIPFGTVAINNDSVPNTPADPSLEWVYCEGKSTTIASMMNDAAPSLVIVPRYTVDEDEEQADWEDDRSLSWDVGSIVLNQVWETEFSLEIFTPGTINIFGDSSRIRFNGGEETLTLPDTYVTALEGLDGTGLLSHQMAIRGVNCTNRDMVEDYFEIVWDLEYDGVLPVIQEIYYMRAEEGMWYLYDNAALPGGPVNEEKFTSHLYVADFPPGDYHIRVYAHAPDADAINQTAAAISLGNMDENYIKIT